MQREIDSALEKNPDDEKTKKLKSLRDETVEKGKKNNEAYLVSDHLDAYVATSMRLKHEYMTINKITKKIFEHSDIKDMQLRYFDPTQAYCDNRIDKGLTEALMLRRASCTIYLAQESDTLGKDSELASTLAQGKAVIAYIPTCDDAFFEEYLDILKQTNKGIVDIELLLEQLKIFKPNLAWEDETVMEWIRDKDSVQVKKVKEKLKEIMRDHYNKRADTLSNKHPLCIQVHLDSGVANGVLVVRTIDDCVKLLKKIILNDTEFNLDFDKDPEGNEHLYLKEKISNCIHRVMSGNKLLSNSFWNHYLELI